MSKDLEYHIGVALGIDPMACKHQSLRITPMGTVMMVEWDGFMVVEEAKMQTALAVAYESARAEREAEKRGS